jgi:hypothetical protein
MIFSPTRLSTNPLNRLLAFGLALVWTAATFMAVLTPAPAEARGNGPYYTVELAQPTSETKAIAGGVAFRCKGATCVASKGKSRPIRVCRELQRKVGSIASFTAKGEALAEDKLARCNG